MYIYIYSSYFIIFTENDVSSNVFPIKSFGPSQNCLSRVSPVTGDHLPTPTISSSSDWRNRNTFVNEATQVLCNRRGYYKLIIGKLAGFYQLNYI